MTTMPRPRHNSTSPDGIAFGLLPSRYDEDDNMGHVWLFWLGTESPLQSFRGFWPDPDDPIPPEYVANKRQFFYENSVRGLIRVDYRAMELMRRFGPQCRHVSWSLQPAERLLLDFHGFVPARKDHRVFGRYSCNEDRLEWHNCSSWAKWVLDTIGGENSFFSCSRPKRLTGVFDLPKATGTSTAIAAGVKTYWDVADQQAKADDESGANKYLGKTVRAAADADTTVRIRLEQ